MKSLIVFFWLLAIILATSWFFFWPGMFYLHDYLHTARIAEMTRAVADGHFPVRWSGNFGYGYGMPLFEFYAPLPFYVGSALALIGIPLLVVTKILFILCNIFTAVGSYKLGRSWYGRVGGLLTAAAISLAPYRAVNLYVRGALSESWGIMAIIWIVYFLYETAKGARLAWIGLTISLSVLFLSHNLLTLLFVPFSVVLGLASVAYVYFKDRKTRKNLLKPVISLLAAYVLATGISAFYLFSAYLEKGFTQVEQVIVGGYFDYSLHFVYLRQFVTPTWGYGGSNWGPVDGISFFLGFGQLIGLVIAAVALALWGLKLLKNKTIPISKPRWWLSVVVLGLLFFSVLLSTEKTVGIWQAVEVLQFVQFPWRFLSITIVYVGLVLPVFLYSQQSFVKRWLWGWLLLLVFFANAVFFKPQAFIENPAEYYTGDAAAIQNQLSKVLPDYLPTAAAMVEPPSVLATCDAECSVEVVENKTHQKKVVVNAAEPTMLTFSSNYFPGWYGKVDGSNVDFSVIHGLFSVSIPEGIHEVEAQFGNTQLRATADMVSLVSIIILAVVLIFEKTKKYETA